MLVLVLVSLALLNFAQAQNCAGITCSSFTACGTCVSAASQGCCGWCRSTSTCLSGGSQGSTPPTLCSNPATNWIYGGVSKILSQTNGFPVNPVFFNVYLYPNSPLSLPVTVINPLTDTVPLDLYIMEDVSGSMGDDVATFYTLARALTVDVLRYQTNPRFGLASFGEKPMYPYGLDPFCQSGSAFQWPASGSTWQFNGAGPTYSVSDFGAAPVAGEIGFAAKGALTHCPPRTATSGPFNWAFCHELDLTNNYPSLQITVGTLVTHVNGDWPEDQMEALMYSAVCPMGWRAGAKRVVLVATDADYHTPIGSNCSSNPPCPASGGAATPACFTQSAQYTCTQDLGTNRANAPSCNGCSGGCAGLNCATANVNVPGTRNDYPDPARVASLLSAANIVPIIASAKAPPDHDDLGTWQRTINTWGFGKVLELSGDSSNLITLIRQALAELSTVMVMTLCSTCDPYDQVTNYLPLQGYTAVPSGAKRFFTINLLDTNTVEVSTIKFSVVGFGEVTINVTNQIPCLGCDGSSNPSIIVDMCGECNGANTCLGCDGIPYSGTVVDECGVCGGSSRSCYDCLNVKFGGAVYDACFICGGDNSTCTDCNRTIHPPGDAAPFLIIDECGVCGGNGRSCRGCDGLINSTKRRDNCSVCGGDNTSCVVIAPPPPSEVPAIAGGAVAGAVFAAIAIVAVILILGALAKKKWDKMQYMQNQGMTALGASPLYKETGGWQNNPNAAS